MDHKMKLFHQNRGEEDLMVNIKDLGSNISEGDTIEIFDPEDDLKPSRLLLQIPKYSETFPGVQKDTICIEQTIATTFQLRPYKDVIVNKVDPEDVSLELLELTFKDQYLSRSDMWRLKRNLINTVMYINKKIEYCSSSIRCQLYEMWAKGEKVSCGIVNEDTKVVFRSSTCQAYLFIQMSCEMWEFDIYGDLYFEKAVNGFLAELFSKWKQEGSNHDVTIVLFSRTYYEASHIDEFPECMRDCLQEDYQGRFYEDFYRVAVQNERYDDWMPIINHLLSLFHNYAADVQDYHQMSPDVRIPKAYNSSAQQGNFLEVLNISLNVFEKHFQDRSFDRTGQMSVVITPGVGVFEVDRELTNITKQRIIDNGVGSDLVCVGEQPFHAVPLLKFHKKKESFRADDYSMPHTWINLSYYSSNKTLGYGTFIPRIKLPTDIARIVKERVNLCPPLPSMKSATEEDSLLNPVFNFDNYDGQIFKLPTNQNSRNNWSLQRTPARKKTTSQSLAQPHFRSSFPHKLSDPDLHRSSELSSSFLSGSAGSAGNLLAKSPAINIPTILNEYKSSFKSIGALNIEGTKFSHHSEFDDMSPSYKSKFGSSGTNSPNDAQHHALGKLPNLRPGRSLINPFDPSHVYIKRTSNRRRWIHIFPKGPTGLLMQQHHYRATSNLSEEEDLSYLLSEENIRRSSGERRYRTVSSREDSQGMKHSTLLWGATGEQEWNAEITTGVDWKSLSLPACLPLTTDYFPDKQSLNNDYIVASNYSLDPDYINEVSKVKGYASAYEVFMEVVRQRLAQGFQLIVPSTPPQVQSSKSLKSFVGSRPSRPKDRIEEYKLSIGRVFHWVHYSDSSIDVTVYRPRHPYDQLERRYKYRFRSPYLNKYEISWAEFKTERLEDYKWNYLDNYICLRRDLREMTLLQELKYWRFRVLIVPDAFRTETKRLMDSPYNTACDIFHSFTLKDQQVTTENFLRFLEVMHKIKKRSRNPTSVRERLGSARTAEKPKFRSGAAKTTTRIKFESGNKDDSVITKMPSEFDDDTKEDGEENKLSLKSNLGEIVEAMKDPNHGVPFISASSSLPACTFIAADATLWACQRIEEIPSEVAAVKFLKSLLDGEYIKPVCGKKSREFIHGFILFTFSVSSESIPDEMPLELKWTQISFNPLSALKNDSSNSFIASLYPSCPVFLWPQLPTQLDGWSAHYSSSLTWKTGIHNRAYVDIDIGNKSDRYEWGHLKYMTQYSPLEGYELVLQWMCATGPIVNELMLTWKRKADTCGLHLFPVPNDPFALSYSYNSNPLRGPLIIPLDVGCLREQANEVFCEFPPESRAQRLYLLQESILERFGFMRYIAEAENSLRFHFVHATGNMFALINCDNGHDKNSETNPCRPKHKAWMCPKASMEQPSFIWSFNFMLSRRWKSPISGDEALGEKILRDFKAFCLNTNHRLRDFYASFLCTLEEPLSPTQPFADVDFQ